MKRERWSGKPVSGTEVQLTPSDYAKFAGGLTLALVLVVAVVLYVTAFAMLPFIGS